MSNEMRDQILAEKRYRILDENKDLVPATVLEWANFYENTSRMVRRTNLNRRKHIFVSTVFLGMDHGFSGEALWFETMIFGTSMDQDMFRYPDWKSAVLGHERAVGAARGALQFRNRGFSGGRRGIIRMNRELKRMRKRRVL